MFTAKELRELQKYQQRIAECKDPNLAIKRLKRAGILNNDGDLIPILAKSTESQKEKIS